MSEQFVNSYSGAGAPMLPGQAPPADSAVVPPPPATAPLASPSLPGLPAVSGSATPTLDGPPAHPTAPGNEPLAPAAPLGENTAIGLPTLPGPGAAPPPPATPPVDQQLPASMAATLPSSTTSDPEIATIPADDVAPASTPTSSEVSGIPSLPPAGGPPATAAPEIDAAGDSTDNSVDKLGLPIASAAAAPSEIPEWKRRQDSKARKFAARFFVLAFLGAVGVGGWFVYQTQLATESGEAEEVDETPAVEQDPAPGVIGDARAVVDDINDNEIEEELLGQLSSRGAFEPTEVASVSGDIINDGFASAAAAQSWVVEWNFPNDPMTLSVDTSSGDFGADFELTNDQRFVGGQHFESADNGATWTPVEPGPAQQSVAALTGSLPTFETALPLEVRDFIVIAEASEIGTGQFLIDDVALFAQNPDARAAWLTTWGLDPTVAPIPPIDDVDDMPTEGVLGHVLVTIAGGPDFIGTQMSVSSPALGGASSYAIIDVSDSPRTIAAPAAQPGS